MVSQLPLPLEEIAGFCRRWHVRELALFGSVLRAQFRPDSDIDVLFSMSPGASYGWNEYCEMKEELEKLFGRRVDFVDRKVIESSPNWLRRREILANCETVYAAR